MLNKRVLILDDHLLILDVIKEALLYANYEVLIISQGKHFFSAVAEFQPHLILLDYVLADTNGGDLCKQLKAIPGYAHIPVIISSAYFNPSENISPGGCDGVLYKPFDLDILLNTVAAHLKKTGTAGLYGNTAHTTAS